MDESKFLVEITGTPVDSDTWRMFNLPSVEPVVEHKTLAVATVTMRQLANQFFSTIRHELAAKNTGVLESEIEFKQHFAHSSIQIGNLYIKINIVRETPDGKRQTPVLYKVQTAARENYGIEDVTGYVREGMEIPAFGLLFAQRYKKSGDLVSLLVDDQGKEFRNNLAQRLLENTEINVAVASGFRGNDEVVNYYLPMKNEDCTIFQPTVFKTVSDCSNVATEFDIEIVFAFDDFLLPMVITRKTDGKTGCPWLPTDVFKEAIQALCGSYEDAKDFFECSPNCSLMERDEGFILHTFSLDGKNADIEMTPERFQHEDLCQAITSVRMVRIRETIIPD